MYPLIIRLALLTFLSVFSLHATADMALGFVPWGATDAWALPLYYSYGDGRPGQSGLPFGQSFTSTLDGDLHSISVFANGSSPDAGLFNMTVDIHNGDGTNGNLLDSKVFAVSAASLSFFDVLTFNFDSDRVHLYNGQQYTFDISAVSDNANEIVQSGLIVLNSRGYSGGNFISPGGFSKSATLAFIVDFSPLTYDLTNPGRELGHGGVPVPEPSSLLLMLTGLAYFFTRNWRFTRLAAALPAFRHAV